VTMTTQKYRLIDTQSLRTKIESNNKFYLWNTLAKEYYKPEANIPGSTWVPVEQVSQAVKDFKIAKDDIIVTYCGGVNCPSSKQAAEKLAYLGFTHVWAYEGGIQAWSESGLPLVKI